MSGIRPTLKLEMRTRYSKKHCHPSREFFARGICCCFRLTPRKEKADPPLRVMFIRNANNLAAERGMTVLGDRTGLELLVEPMYASYSLRTAGDK